MKMYRPHISEIFSDKRIYTHYILFQQLSVELPSDDVSHAKLIDLVSWLTNKIDKASMNNIIH